MRIVKHDDKTGTSSIPFWIWLQLKADWNLLFSLLLKANQKQGKTNKHLISLYSTGPSMTLALLSWTFCTAMLQTLVPMNVGQQISRVLIPLPAHLLALRNLVLFWLLKFLGKCKKIPLRKFPNLNLWRWKQPLEMNQHLVLHQGLLFQLKTRTIFVKVKMLTLKPGLFLLMIQPCPLNGEFFSKLFSYDLAVENGILYPKLFWPSVKKKCSSDWEKVFRSLEQSIRTVKSKNEFWDRMQL